MEQIDQPVIYLTFEDWKNGKIPFEFKKVYPFERQMHRDFNGEYNDYTLSIDEYKKIFTDQKAIFERLVNDYLEGLKAGFATRLAKALDKQILIEAEIKRIKRTFSDGSKDAGIWGFTNVSDNSISYFGGELAELFAKTKTEINPFVKWYSKIIEQGNYDVIQHMKPNQSLDEPIVIHVLFEYKKFLESELKFQKVGIEKIISAVLKLYPSCENQRKKFEADLKKDFDKLDVFILDEGVDVVLEDYKKQLKNCKEIFRETDWNLINEFGERPANDEKKAVLKIWAMYHQSIIEMLTPKFATATNPQKEIVEPQTNPQKEPPKKKDLPKFEQAVNEPDKLPDLWKRLSKMEKPFVSQSGKFIWDGVKVQSVLRAFAQSLVNKDRMKKDFTVNDTYLILCRYFEVKPAPRPEKATITQLYRDFLRDLTGYI